MKPLKEIGKPSYTYKYARNGLGGISVTQHINTVSYTLDELRELLERALEQYNKLCFHARNGKFPSVEEFLKSEGL